MPAPFTTGNGRVVLKDAPLKYEKAWRFTDENDVTFFLPVSLICSHTPATKELIAKAWILKQKNIKYKLVNK